jgi:hypothetical protein
MPRTSSTKTRAPSATLAAILAASLAATLALTLPATALAQARKLRVVSNDSVAIEYAWVSVQGATGQITDDKGEVSLGAGKRKTVTANVRRLGYQPWFGKIDLPDTAAIITIVLPRLAQALGTVQINGRARPAPSLQPFYDRWMMRQQGVISATFIGPEELEFRHPREISDVLSGLNGVSLQRTPLGDYVAFGYNGQCPMAILVDGIRQCPPGGCHTNGGGNAVEIAGGGQAPDLVPLNELINASDVAAMEIYSRGGNMPISLQISDPGCGVIAFWTGSRR